jgi:hypothetical protein
MCGAVLCAENTVERDELEEMLEGRLYDDFNTDAQDGSANQVLWGVACCLLPALVVWWWCDACAVLCSCRV